MSVAREELLESADPHDHYVQLYASDPHMLAVNVAYYIHEGLSDGTLGIVIATEETRKSIAAELNALGTSPRGAQRDSRVLMLDAEETLSRFLVDGYPDAALFDQSVGNTVRAAIAQSNGAGIRAYGEMVGVLWNSGEYPAAIRLEQLWNRLRKAVPFNLFCGYAIDVFGNHFDARVLEALLCAHTHLLPAGPDGKLESAVMRAMDDFLGSKVAPIHSNPVGEGAAALPKGEAMILWLRAHLPDRADEILERARSYYRSSQPV